MTTSGRICAAKGCPEPLIVAERVQTGTDDNARQPIKYGKTQDCGIIAAATAIYDEALLPARSRLIFLQYFFDHLYRFGMSGMNTQLVFTR